MWEGELTTPSTRRAGAVRLGPERSPRNARVRSSLSLSPNSGGGAKAEPPPSTGTIAPLV